METNDNKWWKENALAPPQLDEEKTQIIIVVAKKLKQTKINAIFTLKGDEDVGVWLHGYGYEDRNVCQRDHKRSIQFYYELAFTKSYNNILIVHWKKIRKINQQGHTNKLKYYSENICTRAHGVPGDWMDGWAGGWM